MVKKTEERKDVNEGKKDIFKTWADSYAAVSKMWEDSYLKLYNLTIGYFSNYVLNLAYFMWKIYKKSICCVVFCITKHVVIFPQKNYNLIQQKNL